MRRPFAEEFQQSWGLANTVKSHAEQIRELQIAPREGDIVVNRYTSGGVGGSSGGGGGGAITVQEEDGAPIDTAVTIIRVPNGGLIDNGAGDVSFQFGLPGGSAHIIHEEVAAGLTARASMHFMGLGVTALDNASRTEVVIPTVYDAIVDSADTNAAGKGNCYATLQAAITAGAKSILYRQSTDASDITIGAGDAVNAITGVDSRGFAVPVNIRCERPGVLFSYLHFTSKRLSLAAIQCRAFGVLCDGTLTMGTALTNGAVTPAATTIAFDGGLNGGLVSGYVRIDHEYLSHTAASGHAVAGTLSCANGRGHFFVAKIDHADNREMVDIGRGHIELLAADCDVTACYFIGCLNSDAQCVYIDGGASGARLTACGFLANTTFSLVSVSQTNVGGITGNPQGVEIIGCKGRGNVCKNFEVQSWGALNSASGGYLHAPKINGCSFSGIAAGGIGMTAVRANFAGNTLTSGNNGPGNRTNPADYSGSLTGMAATDKSIPLGADGGTGGTIPRMGIVRMPNGEYASFADRKLTTTSGTSTATSATTLTDGGAAWTPEEWIGQVIVAATSWGIVISNTPTAVTVDAWRGGTPGAVSAYAIRASMVGMVRGLNGTTAVALANLDTLTYMSETAFRLTGTTGGGGVQANIISGNTLAAVRCANYYDTDTYLGLVHTAQVACLLTGNTYTLCSDLIVGPNYSFSANLMGGLTVDCLNRANVSFALTGYPQTGIPSFTNVAADTQFPILTKTIEVNVGPTPVTRGRFTITDSLIQAYRKLVVTQAPGPYTGKGTRMDEAEMDPIICHVDVSAGAAIIRWQTVPIWGRTNQRVGKGSNYAEGDQSHMAVRLGRVRGNIKFHYQIL